MKRLEKLRDKFAEEYTFNYGTAHGLRDEPAWHYSLIDYKQGFDAATKELMRVIEIQRSALLVISGETIRGTMTNAAAIASVVTSKADVILNGTIE